MKKIISQISLILLIITIGISSVFINQANAVTSIDVSISPATEGENFTIKLEISDPNIGGVNCTVQVVFSDGTTSNLSVKGETGIAWAKDIDGVTYGSDSITFLAKVPGTAKVKITGIDLADVNSDPLDGIKTLEKTIEIKAKAPEIPPQNPGVENKVQNTTINTNTTNTNTTNNNTTNNNTTNTNTTNTNTTNTTKNTVNNNTVKEEVKEPKFKDVNETVYAINGCNVRSSCSTSISSNKIGQLIKGQAIKRTGISEEWSRIDFNGNVAYVATDLLSLERPEEDVENKIDNSISNNTTDDNLIEENEISREELLNKIEKEVGVLPEVGNNIATKMFIIISFISLIAILRLQYKTKE